jgi:hypothetical protein
VSSFIAFLAKPLWYLALLVLAAVAFRAHGPHWRWPSWLVVIIATLARLAAGFVSLAAIMGVERLSFGRSALDGPLWLMIPLIGLFGFGLWWATARLAFRRTPRRKLLLFALVAELASGTVDALALNELAHINFC